MVREGLPKEGKIATVLLLAFGIALTPPVVHWVNTEALVAGWPAMFLWAVFWAFFAVAVLAWAAQTGAFGLNDDQIPPELLEEEEVVPAGEVSPETDVEPEGGDD